eukprot:SAG31_NODE_397_length_16251_cov_7.922486_9_plen_57_part_00
MARFSSHTFCGVFLVLNSRHLGTPRSIGATAISCGCECCLLAVGPVLCFQRYPQKI